MISAHRRERHLPGSSRVIHSSPPVYPSLFDKSKSECNWVTWVQGGVTLDLLWKTLWLSHSWNPVCSNKNRLVLDWAAWLYCSWLWRVASHYTCPSSSSGQQKPALWAKLSATPCSPTALYWARVLPGCGWEAGPCEKHGLAMVWTAVWFEGSL